MELRQTGKRGFQCHFPVSSRPARDTRVTLAWVTFAQESRIIHVGFWRAMAHYLCEGRLAILFMNDTKQQEEALFEAARRLADPAQRKTFLDLGCGGDNQMRSRNPRILASQSGGRGFFARGCQR